ncbi:MAG: PHP domain-containing protein, partial [Alphaproteobacteria bacterium]|nr:PHP domain-containing protein [Alphaproteobacteria bacterium]
MKIAPSPAYAELQVSSNFSFLRGASHGEELVTQAKILGHKAIAITDRNSLAGVVRAHVAAKDVGIKLLVGARLDLQDAPSMLCFPQDRQAYGRLCRLLTMGMLRGEKGDCFLWLDDVFGPENGGGQNQVFVVVPPDDATPRELVDTFAPALDDIRNKAGADGPIYLAGHRVYRGDDERRLATLSDLATVHGVPLVATNDIHAHEPGRKPLQDVLWCIREHCTVAQAGFRLSANAERHLKAPTEMARLFADYPDAIARTIEVADLVTFSLDELRYEYPEDVVPSGETPQSELQRLTWIGAKDRYPDGVPDKVRGLVEHELELISALQYAPYFLTVYDIVRFARDRDILCQGRGSAANSAVCYCLGITAVDPDRIELLFERFVSAERDEPPDIDVDFEHERREEVIQYIYDKYGRDRAGMTATVISYRTRSAVREVSKALGLSQDVAGALVGMVWGYSRDELPEDNIREAGLDPSDPRLRQVLDLSRELRGFPRHLSQHVGGFVITRGPLSEVVPISNAAMEDRTVIEWDKDDLDALGILKVDVLGLGMLTCIRKGFDLLRSRYGQSFDLAQVPAEDSGVYDMLCKGDSLGVFQVESRAQMTMLPRLKPRTFYDLVIEVAIVRPGPIQGDMVHPYLRRRNGEEEVVYPSKELE